MARQRQPKADDFDFDNDLSDTITPGAPVEQPPPIRPADAVANPLAMLAKTLGLTEDQLGNVAAANEKANLFAVAAQTRAYAQQIRSEEEQAHLQKCAGQSAGERSQEIVDAAWGQDQGAVRYRVWHASNPEAGCKVEPFPLEIPARSPEEAQARYLKTCGIHSTGHRVRAVPVEEIRRRREQARMERAAEESFDHAGME